MPIRVLGILMVPLAVLLISRWAPQAESLVGPYYAYSSKVSNVVQWMGQPVQYRSATTCQACHADKLPPYGTWAQSPHGTVNCQNCHGVVKEEHPSAAPPVVDTSRGLCLRCHAVLSARPIDFPQVDPLEHGGGQACVACHNPHDPKGSPASKAEVPLR